MAKVLISFLGTGPFESKDLYRTYREANYFVDQSDLGKYPFVSAALKKYHKVDRVILVGTVHSMWEEVYRWFSTDAKKDVQEDVYWEIASACEKASHKSELVIPHREEIEQAIGNGSKVILIKYGIKEQEISDNINIILGLQQYLNDKDELIVDVTHSFRSLPMFIMNLLIYLQNVSSKKIEISHIHYGMLEVTKELGYTPILDLKAMMDVQEWITGAYNFKEFGNTYKISELLKKDNSANYSDIADTAKKFADVKNLNYLKEFRSGISNLSSLCNRDHLPELGKEVIAPVMKKFTKRFSKNLKQSTFQFRMADWHNKHHNYGYALMVLIEAIVTYCCEIKYAHIRDDKDLEMIINDKGIRDIIKDVLNNNISDSKDYQEEVDKTNEKLKIYFDTFDEKSSYDGFLSHWRTANKDRNDIVHNRMGEKPYDEIIKDLNTNIDYFRTYVGR